MLDFFSGSATTAATVLQVSLSFKCRFLVIQLPEDMDSLYKNSSPSDKIKIKNSLDMLDYNKRLHTLDQIGIERLIRAAKKIKEENPDTTVDLGFKHYTLNEVSENTLDKLEKFDPSTFISDKTIYDTFGANTILTTWLVHDGYGFNNKAESINLNGYTAYWCDKHLYLIEPNLNENSIKALVEKYNYDGEFNPQNVIVFGYSFDFVNMESLKTNLKILKDSEKSLRINIDIRY